MDRILMGHGSGGRLSHELVERIIVPMFSNPLLDPLEDSATVDFHGTLAFTTDSFVVAPLFFPGGDIGTLSVCGTVNDLAMSGATPLYLSLALILEEGFSLEDLTRIAKSVARTAHEAEVRVVTGDTKVVNRGMVDGVFINTAGVGRVREGIRLSSASARPGDAVVLSGAIGEHGLAVLSCREGLAFGSQIRSDCACLHGLVAVMLDACPTIRVLRDPTRGGLASSLNEIAERSQVGIHLCEPDIPVRTDVASACDMLGLDPLYVANEGKLVAIVPREHAQSVVAAMQRHPLGTQACVIGEVVGSSPGRVIMRTGYGTSRVVDMLAGDPLPRIC